MRERVRDFGEGEGDVEAGAADAGAFKIEELLGDLGAGEPEGEGLESGVALIGDVSEGEIGVGEEIEDLLDGVGGIE